MMLPVREVLAGEGGNQADDDPFSGLLDETLIRAGSIKRPVDGLNNLDDTRFENIADGLHESELDEARQRDIFVMPDLEVPP